VRAIRQRHEQASLKMGFAKSFPYFPFPKVGFSQNKHPDGMSQI